MPQLFLGEVRPLPQRKMWATVSRRLFRIVPFVELLFASLWGWMGRVLRRLQAVAPRNDRELAPATTKPNVQLICLLLPKFVNVVGLAEMVNGSSSLAKHLLQLVRT